MAALEHDPVHHAYRGARALVLLHEGALRDFVLTWNEAKAAGVTLPDTDDPDYASLESLLVHVLACARGYMTWICECLELPDPAIEPVPGVDAIEARADEYTDHVLALWRTPLRDVPAKDFGRTFPSRWKVVYSIDAMLEHAVMHPIRHEFQIRELLAEQD